jgi:hypothetical protein
MQYQHNKLIFSLKFLRLILYFDGDIFRIGHRLKDAYLGFDLKNGIRAYWNSILCQSEFGAAGHSTIPIGAKPLT